MLAESLLDQVGRFPEPLLTVRCDKHFQIKCVQTSTSGTHQGKRTNPGGNKNSAASTIKHYKDAHTKRPKTGHYRGKTDWEGASFCLKHTQLHKVSMSCCKTGDQVSPTHLPVQTLMGLKFNIYLLYFCGRSQKHKVPTNGT